MCHSPFMCSSRNINFIFLLCFFFLEGVFVLWLDAVFFSVVVCIDLFLSVCVGESL